MSDTEKASAPRFSKGAHYEIVLSTPGEWNGEPLPAGRPIVVTGEVASHNAAKIAEHRKLGEEEV